MLKTAVVYVMRVEKNNYCACLYTMELKILSWNIWIDGYFDKIIDFLKASDADIIGLQEVRADDSTRDVVEYLTGLGYQHAFAPIKQVWGGKTWHHGPAVFSKYDIRRVEKYDLSDTDNRAAVRADIQVAGTTLHVLSTHLIHTHQQESHEQEKQGANLLKVIPSERTIVMGDFNAMPDSAVIQSFKKVLIDADPASLPTWSMYKAGCPKCSPPDISIRLDYIFTTKDIKTRSYKVEQSTGSDHLPVSVIVEL